MIDDDNTIGLEFAALDDGVSPEGIAWLGPRDDGERVVVNHVIADLDATAKFGEMLARVARALINHRGDRRSLN